MAVLVGAGAGKGGEGAPSVPLEVTLPAFPAVSVGAGGAHSPGLSVLLLLPGLFIDII